jgi:putative tricarboxylic transport membrane protein
MQAESTRTRTISFPILLIGFGGVTLFLSRDLPDFIQRGQRLPGPKLFPVMMGAFLVVAGVIELVQWLLARSRGTATPFQSAGLRDVAAFVGAVVLFAVLLPVLGFQVTGLLFGTLVLRTLDVRWSKAVLVPLLLVVVITLLFGVAFLVPLPWGVLGFLR